MIIQIVQQYFGASVLAIPAIICLVILASRGNKCRSYILAYFIGLLFVANDLTYFVAKKLGEATTFYRILWNIPIAVLTALLLILLFEQMGNWYKKVIYIVIIAAAFLLVKSISVERLMRMPETPYFVQQDAIDICEIIHEDAGEDAFITAYMDDALMYGVRQYDAHIKVVTTDDYKNFDRLLIKNSEGLEGKTFRASVRSAGLKYISVKKEYTKAQIVCRAGGCTQIGDNGNYVVYRTNLEETVDLMNRIDAGEYSQNGSVYVIEDVVIDNVDGPMEFFYDSSNRLFVTEEDGDVNYIIDGKKTFQSVSFDYFIICAIDNSKGYISNRDLIQFRKLQEENLPIVLLLSKPLYLESMNDPALKELYMADMQFVEEVSASDSNVAAIFTGERGAYYSRYYVNDNCYQCICEPSGSEEKAIIRVRTNEQK